MPRPDAPHRAASAIPRRSRASAAGVLLEYVADDRVFVLLGSGARRLPLPLVREESGWRFRAAVGRLAPAGR